MEQNQGGHGRHRMGVLSGRKCVRVTIGDQRLSFSEMQTFLYETANLLNERPIGMLPICGEDPQYLCPNDCLLGRTTIKAPCGDFDVTCNSKKRIWFVQRITDQFWKKWTTYYFPSLLIRKKWHTDNRDLAIDDVVIIYDKDLPRGHWKIGIITQATPSSDGRVRHVLVKYKNHLSKSYTEIERPVQKLIVILSADERSDLDRSWMQ